MTIEIRGEVAPGFEGVREVFLRHFEEEQEVGAGLAVVVAGVPVVDLWGGFADRARSRPWERDSLVNVFSTTKGMTALCAHLLVDRGELDLDAPVCRYWPEFAAAGKQEISVRQLLSHQAGLPAVRAALPEDAMYDWPRMTEALAAESPWWEPGTAHGYHAVTFGWLIGELVRRVSGRSLGTFFREEVATPLGADFHIGLPATLDERVADLIPGPFHPAPDGGEHLFAAMMKDPQGMTAKAFMNPPILGDVAMSEAWRRAEIPAANGHASAAGIARIYGALAEEGGGLLDPQTLDAARAEQVYGQDRIIMLTTRIANGFMLAPDEEPCGPNPRAFNHAGAGGSLGFCDPEAGIGLGYAMNLMHFGAWLVDPRARRLVDAVYDCVGAGR